MTDLYEQIRTAVTERLKLAEAARSNGAPGGWQFDDSGSDGPCVHTGAGTWDADILDATWHCDDELDGCPEEARAYIREGRFIAANDPAFTVRACRADLARLEDHKPVPAVYFDPEFIPVEVLERLASSVEPLCAGHGALVLDPDAVWPCVEIKRMAGVYGIEVNP